MTRSITAFALALAFSGTGCIAASDDVPLDEAQAEAEAQGDADLLEDQTLVAEHVDGGRRLAFYESADGGLTIVQATPGGETPLVDSATLGRLGPSGAFAALTRAEAPSVLLELEHRLGIGANPDAPPAPAAEPSINARASASAEAWFTGNFCDSEAYWQALRPSNMYSGAHVLTQYYLRDLVADRLVTNSAAVFNYSAVMNSAASGVVTNRILIDNGNRLNRAAATLPNTVTQIWAWSDTSTRCASPPLSWFLPNGGCFTVWNNRSYQSGVGALDGETASICGFFAGG
jgi:hypothetical protein